MNVISNNKKYTFWLISLFMLIPSAVSAGVYFITKDDSDGGYTQDRPCVADYPLYGPCPDNKSPQNFCPKDSRYFRTCGCDSKYQYTSCTDNKTLSGGSCDGKYEACTCDTTKYKYDSTNCTGGKVLSGKVCGGKYEVCGCPSDYTKTCSSPMIGGEAACDGKYKTCKCPSNFVTCDNGGEIGAAQCTDANGTRYESCKEEMTCATLGLWDYPVSEDSYYAKYGLSVQVSSKAGTCYLWGAHSSSEVYRKYFWDAKEIPNYPDWYPDWQGGGLLHKACDVNTGLPVFIPWSEQASEKYWNESKQGYYKGSTWLGSYLDGQLISSNEKVYPNVYGYVFYACGTYYYHGKPDHPNEKEIWKVLKPEI